MSAGGPCPFTKRDGHPAALAQPGLARAVHTFCTTRPSRCARSGSLSQLAAASPLLLPNVAKRTCARGNSKNRHKSSADAKQRPQEYAHTSLYKPDKPQPHEHMDKVWSRPRFHLTHTRDRTLKRRTNEQLHCANHPFRSEHQDKHPSAIPRAETWQTTHSPQHGRVRF